MTPQRLRAVIGGDPAAVQEFVCTFTPVLRAVVRRTLSGNDAQRIEDVLQDLFVLLFRDGGRALLAWDPALGRSLKVFLCVLAHHRAIDHVRRETRHARERPTTAEDLARQADRDTAAQPAEGPAWLETLFRRFREEASPQDQRLLEMCFLEEMDPREVAAQLDLTPEAVYQRRHRLKQRLLKLKAEILAEEQPGGSEKPADRRTPFKNKTRE